jgi:hypothetical protein
LRCGYGNLKQFCPAVGKGKSEVVSGAGEAGVDDVLHTVAFGGGDV